MQCAIAKEKLFLVMLENLKINARILAIDILYECQLYNRSIVTFLDRNTIL